MRPIRLGLVGLVVGFLGLLAAGIFQPATPQAQAAERKGRAYAFLVACQSYDKKELRPLKFAQNDMTAFAKALIDSGYDKDRIVLMHDGQERRYLPEAAKIKEELTLILDELGPNDSLIVAFSGHGVQYKGDKHAYFCPVDARLEGKMNLIAMDWLYGQMKKCKGRLKLLLVDACRNDPRSALGKGRAEVELADLGLPEQPPKGIVALFSCSEGQESFEDPDLKHGIFFHHVLKGWNGAAANNQGKVTLGALIEYVEEGTQKYARLNLKARQKPEHQNQGSGVWVLTQAGAAGSARTFTNSIGMKLVLIPMGKFTMGSPETEKEREPLAKGSEKEHEVEITQPYYMGAYTVTQEEYEKVMGKNPSWYCSTGKGKEKVDGLDTARFPVEYVSWHDAQEFCRKLTALERKRGFEREYRLPTEAEWEYACREAGKSRTPFHCGNDFGSDQANFNGNYPYGDAVKGPYLGRTTRVGSYKPNHLGLYDMHGNVWQWCADWYGKDYYDKSPIKDPKGPESGEHRVLRGGFWSGNGRNCRAAHRSYCKPGFPNYIGIGFRVVCVVPSRTR